MARSPKPASPASSRAASHRATTRRRAQARKNPTTPQTEAGPAWLRAPLFAALLALLARWRRRTEPLGDTDRPSDLAAVLVAGVLEQLAAVLVAWGTPEGDKLRARAMDFALLSKRGEPIVTPPASREPLAAAPPSIAEDLRRDLDRAAAVRRLDSKIGEYQSMREAPLDALLLHVLDVEGRDPEAEDDPRRDVIDLLLAQLGREAMLGLGAGNNLAADPEPLLWRVVNTVDTVRELRRRLFDGRDAEEHVRDLDLDQARAAVDEAGRPAREARSREARKRAERLLERIETRGINRHNLESMRVQLVEIRKLLDGAEINDDERYAQRAMWSAREALDRATARSAAIAVAGDAS